ncbi:helix-turn-helix domain-containing protein [Rahnella sp. SAP-1]|jgi:putative transcriptional regulator|uniref:Helix-turn-helix domain-containing protein n=1 Tax=Rouxiella aceris TaxID=2703884 RepID=A0A848MR26_9GAMM|nr:helix-turn-helix domain-containing protein [Rouxiella aceris]NMP29312.1 helix-turn-helix domain-containing protein [Rouxiella aceris]
MSERLKRIQGMAQRYNKLGVVDDETVFAIDAAVDARSIPKVRPMTGSQIREVRARYKMSQSALALTTGMSVESVSKWERDESKPNQAALRIINVIEDKGLEVFLAAM